MKDYIIIYVGAYMNNYESADLVYCMAMYTLNFDPVFVKSPGLAHALDLWESNLGPHCTDTLHAQYAILLGALNESV